MSKAVLRVLCFSIFPNSLSTAKLCSGASLFHHLSHQGKHYHCCGKDPSEIFFYMALPFVCNCTLSMVSQLTVHWYYNNLIISVLGKYRARVVEDSQQVSYVHIPIFPRHITCSGGILGCFLVAEEDAAASKRQYCSRSEADG